MVVQSSMFSFFKPTGSSGNKGAFGAGKKLPAAPVPAAKKVPVEGSMAKKPAAATTAALEKKVSESVADSTKQVNATAAGKKVSSPPGPTGGGASNKKKRAIVDSDSEDEFDVDELSVAKPKKKTIKDDDDTENDEEYDEGDFLEDSEDDVSFDDSEDSEDEEVTKAKKGKGSNKRLSKSSASSVSSSKKPKSMKTPSAPTLARGGGSSSSSLSSKKSNSAVASLFGSPSGVSKKSSISLLSPNELTGSPSLSNGAQLSPNNHDQNASGEVDGFAMSFNHEKLDWYMNMDKIRDADKNPVGDANFNKRTLYVPESFLSGQTPAQTQWWDMKSKNNDVIFFFKIGKFYELYHGDADIAVREAGLTYMKGDTAHCGFPELGYGRYAEVLASKGYRVARIEQTETVEDNKERAKKCPSHYSKIEKVLFKATTREICSILSPGTRTYSHFDTMNHNDAAGEATLHSFLKEMNYVYPTTTTLIAIKEIVFPKTKNEENNSSQAVCEYGICLVDSPTSSVMIGQFHDDAQRTRLRTLLTQYPPAEVLTEKGVVSDETSRIISYMCKSALKDELLPQKEFWSAKKAKAEICKEGVYFTQTSFAAEDESVGKKRMNKERYPLPDVLAAVCASEEIEKNEGSNGSASLALSALGACCWLLRRSLIDDDVFSMGKFSAYCPPDLEANESSLSKGEEEGHEMVDSEPVIVQDMAEDFSNSAVFRGLPKQCSQLSDLYWVATGQRFTSGSGSNVFQLSSTAKTTSTANTSSTRHDFGSRMLLDGAALTNLEVLLSTDGDEQGSLFKYLNRTNSSFGKRLLKEWVCAPLLYTPEIEARLSAVKELRDDLSDVEALLKSNLKKLPDLERLLANVHALSSKRRAESHPDSRARIFDFDKLAKRKVSKFADLLDGMKCLLKLQQSLTECAPSSMLLKNLCLKEQDGGMFPDMSEPLTFFSKSFDLNAAKRTGSIEPKPGMDAEYDAAMEDMKTVKSELEEVLAELKQGCLRGSGVKWWHHKTKLEDQYQLEIDAGWLKKNGSALTTETFITKSQTSKFRRFHTPDIVKLLNKLGESAVQQELCKGDAMRKVFARFSESGDIWSRAIRCVATLDVLCSFASISNQHGMVKPEIVDEIDPATGKSVVVLELDQARHPCLLLSPGVESIPNSSKLGGMSQDSAAPRLLLLTGPNMGGKSTLLRQTCLIAIMAQCGCFVPAEQARLSPVDRIFTRLGASDRILAGMSTFFVELSEAAAVLNYATERSLVILDELGRGTSTFDGTAIAHAVVDYLVSSIKCRSLFATHYHSLVEDWGGSPDKKHLVALGHMACVVHSNEFDTSSTDANVESAHPPITFLYTLTEGSSPKSFGINVARLACLPLEVLQLASQKSQQFEASLNKNKDLNGLVLLASQLLKLIQNYSRTSASYASSDGDQVELTSDEILNVWKQSQTFDESLFQSS